MLLRCYGRGKADVERIGTFVREKASTRLRVKRCAPTTPSQQIKRVPVPPEDTCSSSPATQSLFQSDELEGTKQTQIRCKAVTDEKTITELKSLTLKQAGGLHSHISVIVFCLVCICVSVSVSEPLVMK